MTGPVHIETLVSALRDGIVNRPLDQLLVDQTLGQNPNCGIVWIDESGTGDRRRNSGMLRGQHDVINRALRTAEMPVDRKSPGDVRCISIEFTTGINQQQGASAQSCIVVAVVQDAGIFGTRHNRTVGNRLGATTAEFMQ